VPDNPVDLTKFRQRLQEREEKERLAVAQTAATDYEDLVPDTEYDRSETDAEIDQIIDSIDIVDAYRRWCGKMIPVVRNGQREGIKISCPIPGHVDSNPSAWINLDKQVWHCAACEQGGDAYDLAAFAKGFGDYKSDGASFHRLRQAMAEDFGYIFTTLPGNVTVVIPPEPEEADQPAGTTEPHVAVPEPAVEPDASEEPTAEVIELYDDGDTEYDLPTLDWRPIVPEGTFLHEYMKAVCIDDAPEEYHFFHGLLALGFAVGRDVTLFDSVPVYANLFVCTLGRSGVGKSKARGHLDRLLSVALPHDWSDPNSKGVRRVSAPGSGEVLIHNFQKPVEDPSNPKKIAWYAPVRGMIDFNELSALVGRMNRSSSIIKPTLMQFYDMETVVATSSLSTGLKEAHEPFASALTTTQPRSLRALLTGDDDTSGFLNRWIFVPGREKKRFAIGGVQVDIDSAVPALKDIFGWSGSFLGSDVVEWSVEAAERFTDFFNRKIEPDKKKAQNDLIVRIDLTLKKLILLFTINRKLKTVPVEAVNEAILCYEYLVNAYGVPSGMIGNTLSNEVAEAVLYQTKRQYERDKRGMTIGQIGKALKRRKYPMKLLIDTVDNLVKLDMLKMETSKAGQVGRPAIRYRYVD
jgi:hypothetical protein